MPGIGRDVKFTVRMLVKSPTFALVSVLTLALGIGATTAIWSVVDAVVVRPLPYPEPDRLVRVYTEFARQHFDKFWLSTPEYFDLARDATAFAKVAAYAPAGVALSAGTRDRPLRVAMNYATASFAATLGVSPQMGRWYTPEEDLPNQQNVAVISDHLWRTAFESSPDIIGHHVTVDAVPAQIVGVMPPGFGFPTSETDLYLPIGLDPASGRASHQNSVIARLAGGVSVEAARATIPGLMSAWAEGKGKTAHFLSAPNHLMSFAPLKEEVVGSVATTLWILQIAVFLVLLIACANISNLLLARAEGRAREIAIRNALGANRWRLVRQFLTESFVLGGLGGVLGIFVAIWGVDTTVSLLPHGAPRASEIHIDLGVLAFAAACAVGASILFGLAPIMHTRVEGLSQALREGTRSATSARQKLRRLLVVAEVALAVVLLIGCGLMTQSFAKLSKVDIGFDPSNIVTGQIELADKTYPKPADQRAYWVRLEDKLRAIPGVAAATVLSGLPPVRQLNANDFAIEGKAADPNVIWNADFWQIVGDDAEKTLGLRLASGRWLAAGDTEITPPVVMVNEAFARKFFAGEDAVGQRLRMQNPDKATQLIVGVVRDVKQQGVEAPVGTEIYIPVKQAEAIYKRTPTVMNVALKGALDAKSLMPQVRAAVADLDATIPIYQVRTMDDVLYDAVARPRFVAFLLAVFAGLALVLAAVGIYGVMSYTVAQRTRELGIRMALGAQVSGLRRLVLGDGLVLAGVGVVVGLLAAFAVNTLLASRLQTLLYDVKTVDVPTFLGVSVVVLAVATAACLVPALRATRVDPLVALRAE